MSQRAKHHTEIQYEIALIAMLGWFVNAFLSPKNPNHGPMLFVVAFVHMMTMTLAYYVGGQFPGDAAHHALYALGQAATLAAWYVILPYSFAPIIALSAAALWISLRTTMGLLFGRKRRTKPKE